MKKSTFLVGVLAGSITAATAVLLTTSQSGEQLRSNVKQKVDEYKYLLDDVKDKIEEMKFAIQNLTDDAKKTIPATIEELKESVMSWQKSTELNKNNLQQEIATIQQSLEQLEEQLEQQKK